MQIDKTRKFKSVVTAISLHTPMGHSVKEFTDLNSGDWDGLKAIVKQSPDNRLKINTWQLSMVSKLYGVPAYLILSEQGKRYSCKNYVGRYSCDKICGATYYPTFVEGWLK